MAKIKNIVYLMLENRSLDQVLGWLYDEKNPPKVNIPSQKKPSYDGLKTSFFNLDSTGNKQFVVKGTNHNMNVPKVDPHEEYAHINHQVFGNSSTPTSPTPPTMGGFYQDFEGKSDPQEIMQSYTPEELPVLNGLAKNFAVSDRYFCSVPTQTNCNRAFAASGNSIGNTLSLPLINEAWVNNRHTDYLPPYMSQPKGRQFNQKTIWNVLSENGLGSTSDWMQYYSSGNKLQDFLGLEGYSYTRDLMESLQDASFDDHFSHMSEFITTAKAGKLPTFSFLEPEWGLGIFGNGNDYHPPANLAPGEAFVKSIYDALTHNPDAWAETLFIINFDEHGGTYDHVDTPWGAKPPWENPSDGTAIPNLFEGDFQFDRFGVRVPLLLVSPYVKESTVFRAEGDVPYDHTSVIATILNMMGVSKDKWKLGSRTANAPTFENVFEGNTARTVIPKIDVNTKGVASSIDESTVQVNDIQLRMMQSLLDKAVKKKGLAADVVKELSLEGFSEEKTLTELLEKFHKTLKIIKDL